MEKQIFDWINRIANPTLDSGFALITGTYFLIPMLIGLIIFVNRWHIKEDVFTKLIYLIPIGLVVVSTVLVTTAMKETIDAERPCKTMEDIHVVFCKESNSFPSRHTAIAFTALPFIWYARRYFIPLFIYAGIIGFGMVYLGVHYPHDIIAGLMIGYLIGYLFLLKNNWIIGTSQKIKEEIIGHKTLK